MQTQPPKSQRRYQKNLKTFLNRHLVKNNENSSPQVEGDENEEVLLKINSPKQPHVQQLIQSEKDVSYNIDDNNPFAEKNDNNLSFNNNAPSTQPQITQGVYRPAFEDQSSVTQHGFTSNNMKNTLSNIKEVQGDNLDEIISNLLDRGDEFARKLEGDADFLDALSTSNAPFGDLERKILSAIMHMNCIFDDDDYFSNGGLNENGKAKWLKSIKNDFNIMNLFAKLQAYNASDPTNKKLALVKQIVQEFATCNSDPTKRIEALNSQPLTICDQPVNGEAVAENNLIIARNNLMIAMLENPKVLEMIFVANTDGSKLSLKTEIDPKALLGIIENDTSLLKLFIKVTAAVLALAALGVAITAGVAILAPIGIVTAAGVGAGTLALGAGGVAAFAGVGAYIVDTGGEMKQSFVQMEKAKEEVAKSKKNPNQL